MPWYLTFEHTTPATLAYKNNQAGSRNHHHHHAESSDESSN
ncbi:hypothetical protein [Bacillus sp. ISL-18]|nr:hypothetical protein [Bacillus sp. ISL-18]